MDLRLTDNLVDFLHFDNLHNRFDHYILAGASLCCTETHEELFKEMHFDNTITSKERNRNWRQCLFQHLDLAVELHHIDDVYIIEHQDCGAYKGFLDEGKIDLSSKEDEIELHKKFALDLAEQIHAKEWKPIEPKKLNHTVNVHTFFIDLRGNVELMDTFRKIPEKLA
jgi:hypothetical protein